MTPWPTLKSVHLIAGVAGLLAFGGTGLYMDRALDHLAGMPDGPRALYRSGHIYFIVETPPAMVERPMVRRAIVWSLGGVLLHAAAALVLVRRRAGVEHAAARAGRDG